MGKGRRKQARALTEGEEARPRRRGLNPIEPVFEYLEAVESRRDREHKREVFRDMYKAKLDAVSRAQKRSLRQEKRKLDLAERLIEKDRVTEAIAVIQMSSGRRLHDELEASGWLPSWSERED